MRPQSPLIPLLLLTLSGLCANAEDDPGGIWKGTLTQGPGGCYPNYFLELQITLAGDRITGKAYDYYDKTHYVKMSFTGRYNAQTHRMVLIEDRVLEANIPTDCQPCVKTYDLNYARNGTLEELNGDWKGVYSDKKLVCPPGKIRLRKAALSDFPVDVEQSDTLAGVQAALHLQPREKEVVKTLTVKSSSIKIDLYDNAEIDHDTVTVLVNNKVLLYRRMLTDRPLTVTFNAFANLPYEVVMYADNLGDIPPNTALMMITAGDQKFEVFLSSTETKSAAVRIVYRP
ncbi:MAG TPA: hypothetical protein VHE34_14665 [Puia sp.]|uniref:hypothetical protein n=1 Tax=Puia sp. TaxID=2045100 RepID=UPI002B9D48DC|nr:hypothetical protein [Puia sp.]HVU96468.1 hypothetical protein [Puia sp.]